jgi:hypothetical protein
LIHHAGNVRVGCACECRFGDAMQGHALLLQSGGGTPMCTHMLVAVLV